MHRIELKASEMDVETRGSATVEKPEDSSLDQMQEDYVGHHSLRRLKATQSPHLRPSEYCPSMVWAAHWNGLRQVVERSVYDRTAP